MRNKPTTKSIIDKLQNKVKTLEYEVRFLNVELDILRKRVGTMVSGLPTVLVAQLDVMERSLRAHESQINSLWRTTSIKTSKGLRR